MNPFSFSQFSEIDSAKMAIGPRGAVYNVWSINREFNENCLFLYFHFSCTNHVSLILSTAELNPVYWSDQDCYVKLVLVS